MTPSRSRASSPEPTSPVARSQRKRDFREIPAASEATAAQSPTAAARNRPGLQSPKNRPGGPWRSADSQRPAAVTPASVRARAQGARSRFHARGFLSFPDDNPGRSVISMVVALCVPAADEAVEDEVADVVGRAIGGDPLRDA